MSPIEARLHRLKDRVEAHEWPKETRFLIQLMAEWLDPEAIDLLIELLEFGDERGEYASKALVRYGEAAVAPLRARLARAKAEKIEWDDSVVDNVKHTLKRIAYRERLARTTCHFAFRIR